MSGLTQQELETTISVVDQALKATWAQYEALQKLALHYPEAQHVLSSPRKPDVMVILERLRVWLAEPERRQEPASQAPEREGE
jgi:hypothetical protein